MVTSRNRCLGPVLALLCGAEGVCALRADTVALWNFEKDAVWGGVDLRCAVNAANSFSVHGNIGVTDQSVGWYLPPNPDESIDAFSAGNRSAVSIWNNGHKGHLRLASSELSDLLDLRHDFTLEGWMKPVFDPAVNDWYVVANINNGSSGGQAGTIWSLRTGKNATLGFETGQVRFEVFWAGLGDRAVSAVFTDEEVDELTNAWHHVALVFDYENDEGVSEYSFYYDGTKRGSTSRAKRAATDVNTSLTGTYYALELFGRGNIGWVLYGQYDYWRLSDAALTPEQFLCAGGTGTSAPPASSTVGY